jgi:hypothetical protein
MGGNWVNLMLGLDQGKRESLGLIRLSGGESSFGLISGEEQDPGGGNMKDLLLKARSVG